ncbi:hypothetical protein A2704_07095 [Candidatus Kaiserbacteria bacterium RIFCSPHIGHO2_01_FULL_54_36b]|uniref:Uncharacterized protein n=1 Tax=Candidatus Kaiserbacteria bacterium RIFCSPHIGHO2_01_FULL_54_36b TaxID=1798483 RepID=A0A1F6CRX4_9BACT|nr:MAG: hypothetical protein A2704_07095 [Candidatus Kaiserbacteria bacterium RIFCSPHIGHO2_01_FULL_54_36b]
MDFGFNVSLHLSLLGWIGFVLMLGSAGTALWLWVSIFFLRSHGDYDFGTPMMALIRLLSGLAAALVAVILCLLIFR